MIQKIQLTLLLCFSFFIIVIGGYNCSVKVEDGRGEISIVTGGTQIESHNGGNVEEEEERFDVRGNLPDEPDDKCNRSDYRRLVEDFGASAFIDIQNTSSFRDYRLGISENFRPECTRVYLDMAETEVRGGRDYYEGSFYVSYEDGRSIKYQKYSSGSTREDNKHNRWEGTSWNPSSTGKVRQKFYSIFDDETHAAVILVIDEVRERNIRDGSTYLQGAGEVWFKMFKTFVNKSDRCYREGTYVTKARSTPRHPGKKCWLINRGPYACSPLGVNSSGNSILNFDLENKGYDCYSKLGEFRLLNINEAFNLSRNQAHP